MMLKLIIKDLSNKLENHIQEKGGFIHVDSKWTNNWLNDHSAEFKVSIVDKDNNEIKDAKLLITKK